VNGLPRFYLADVIPAQAGICQCFREL